MSEAMGIALMFLSFSLFVFTLFPIIRKERAIVYLLILRLFSAFIFFVAFSVIVIPQTISYGAYNSVLANVIVQYPTYNVTTAIPSGTQSTLGWVSISYIMLVISSIGIDFVMKMRE